MIAETKTWRRGTIMLGAAAGEDGAAIAANKMAAIKGPLQNTRVAFGKVLEAHPDHKT